MSRLIYTVRAECRSCGHEQDVEVQMYDGYSEADVQQALAESDECRGCYEMDWSALLPPDAAKP